MSTTIDVATLDLIENALLNARFEMDEVVRRAAMSPTIRVQHDEFPMICNARGQMVVGQFGSYIPEVIDRFGGEIFEGDVILLNDPYLCKGSISHCNDWLVILPVFYEGERIAFASLFGHMMDVGGKVPGSQVSDALSIWEEGIRIPPIKIFDRGVLNETALDVILNNTRTPDTNRSDLMAIIGGCRAAERRIVEICERFGPETFEAACDALLDRTRRAMAQIIRTYIPEEPQTFTDWVDDDGCGNGPFKMVLTIWREGDVCHADWTGTDEQAPGLDQLPHPRGPLQALPRDLHDHGVRPRDPLQRRHLRRLRGHAPGGLAAEPEVPGAALEPAERPHPPVRLHERRPRPEGSGALDGSGVRDEPVLRLRRLRRRRRVLPVRRAPLRRPAGPVQGRRARRALVVAALPDDARGIRGELLPRAHLELRAGARHRRRGLPPRRHGDREDVRVHRRRGRSR